MTPTNNQRKVFITIIAILLLANIAMIGFILKSKGPLDQAKRPDKKEMITAFLKNDVGFSQQQLVQFDSLNSQHRQKMGGLSDSARNSKNAELHHLAADNFSDSAIELAIEKSCTVQKPVERQMLSYIKSIRQLCTTDQLPAFDSLYVKIFTRRGNGKRKN